MDKFKGKNIAVYGLGVKSEDVINKLKNYAEKIYLVGEKRIGEKLFGYEVLSIHDILNKVDVIILAVQNTSIKEVYNRVKFVDNIEIYDLSLRNISAMTTARKKAIDGKISFDDFMDKSDKYNKIYFEFENVLSYKSELIEGEYCPRNDVLNAVKKNQERGKDLFIINNSVLRKAQLKSLLEMWNINLDINKILEEEVFLTYLDEDKFNVNDLLIVNSYENIVPRNIQKIIIPTALQIVKKFGFTFMDNVKTNRDKAVGENILNTLFNNPFNEKINLSKENIDVLGYNIFGPLTIYFLEFVDSLNLTKNDIILFSARDGYFINELFELRKKCKENNPDNKYLYISRRAVQVSNIQNVNDIITIVNSQLNNTQGNLKIRLENQLGLKFNNSKILDRDLSQIYKSEDKEEIVKYVLKYKDIILNNAANEKLNYLNYIQKLELNKYKNVYLFDLYTKGTGYLNLKKFVSDLRLICFATKENSILEKQRVYSVFGNVSTFSEFSFFSMYQLFEIVYASNEGQFKSIKFNGEFEFVENTEYNYEYLAVIQQGIKAFYEDYFSYETDGKLSLEFVDSLVELLCYFGLSNETLKTFEYNDGFGAESYSNLWDKLIID